MSSGKIPDQAEGSAHFSICSGCVKAISKDAEVGVSVSKSSNGLRTEVPAESRRYKSALTESQQTVTSSALDCSISGLDGKIIANKKQPIMSIACLCILSPMAWLHHQRITSTLVCEDMV